MGNADVKGQDRWPVRGAGVVGGFAAALLSLFVVPAEWSFTTTLGIMAVVGGLTAIQAARQPVPSGAGAVSGGVIAILLVIGSASLALQTRSASPASGPLTDVFQQGAFVIAGLGVVLGAFAAAVSVFFWKRSRRQRAGQR